MKQLGMAGNNICCMHQTMGMCMCMVICDCQMLYRSLSFMPDGPESVLLG